MKKILYFSYGVVSYFIFFATFIYAIGFVGNIVVPKSIDAIPETSLTTAILTNLVLLSIFAIQHSVMARPSFKKQWTKIVPKPLERSTYVLFSSIALIILFAYWQPMGGIIWSVTNPVGQTLLYGVFAIGWLLVLLSTFLINHFDLFGLRQVMFYLKGKSYTELNFNTPWLYRYVRHPLYVGWLFAFWATPIMTFTHLLFALVTTAYILIAIQLEERNLMEMHPEYAEYRKNVPMLIPLVFSKKNKSHKQHRPTTHS